MVRHTPSVADYRAASPEDGGGIYEALFAFGRMFFLSLP